MVCWRPSAPVLISMSSHTLLVEFSWTVPPSLCLRKLSSNDISNSFNSSVRSTTLKSLLSEVKVVSSTSSLSVSHTVVYNIRILAHSFLMTSSSVNHSKITDDVTISNLGADSSTFLRFGKIFHIFKMTSSLITSVNHSQIWFKPNSQIYPKLVKFITFSKLVNFVTFSKLVKFFTFLKSL